MSNANFSTGQRIVIAAPHTVLVEPQLLPNPAADEVVVRTSKSLVSPGTELAMFEGTHSALNDPDIPFAKYPFYPGYAAIGEVVAAGHLTERPKVGEIIFYFGRHTRFQVLRPSTTFWAKCPDDLTSDQILLARLVQIAATATFVWRRKPERVLVLGAGLIGLVAAQVCGIRGVPQVLIHDINSARMVLAANCGLKTTVSASGGSPSGNWQVDGEAPDCIVEATGVPELIPSALRAVARGGDVVLLGSPRGKVAIDVYRDVHQKGVALIGAHETQLPEEPTASLPSRGDVVKMAWDWIRQRKVRVDGLVSHTIMPESMPATYARMAQNKSELLGVMLDWD